jgi:cytoskeleton protein RodZ
MSKSGFGERLKRDRELRGVSRDEVCAATRIGPRYLEALENEQWERLPGGVFNRGFLRAVARFLGLDEDDLLAQYDLAINESIEGQNSHREARVTPPVMEKPGKGPVSRAVLLATLCAIVLLGTGWFSWRWYPQPVQKSATPNNRVVSGVAAAHQLDGNAPSASVEPAGSPASAALPAIASSSGTLSQALELKIEAGKETAVSVSADGSKVFEGSMIAGQSRKFTAQDAIDISAKDAGALLLELNGQTLAPLGPPGQPGNVTLTRSDVKPTGGGAD